VIELSEKFTVALDTMVQTGDTRIIELYIQSRRFSDRGTTELNSAIENAVMEAIKVWGEGGYLPPLSHLSGLEDASTSIRKAALKTGILAGIRVCGGKIPTKEDIERAIKIVEAKFGPDTSMSHELIVSSGAFKTKSPGKPRRHRNLLKH